MDELGGGGIIARGLFVTHRKPEDELSVEGFKNARGLGLIFQRKYIQRSIYKWSVCDYVVLFRIIGWRSFQTKGSFDLHKIMSVVHNTCMSKAV